MRKKRICTHSCNILHKTSAPLSQYLQNTKKFPAIVFGVQNSSKTKKKQPRGCLFQKIFQLVNNLLVVLVLLAWFDKVFRSTFLVMVSWNQLHVEVIHWAVAHGAKVHACAIVHLFQRLHAFLCKHKSFHTQFCWNFRHIFEVLFATDNCVSVGTWIANQKAHKQVVFEQRLFGNVAVQAIVVLFVVAGGANSCVYKFFDCWMFHNVLLFKTQPRGANFVFIICKFAVASLHAIGCVKKCAPLGTHFVF